MKDNEQNTQETLNIFKQIDLEDPKYFHQFSNTPSSVTYLNDHIKNRITAVLDLLEEMKKDEEDFLTSDSVQKIQRKQKKIPHIETQNEPSSSTTETIDRTPNVKISPIDACTCGGTWSYFFRAIINGKYILSQQILTYEIFSFTLLGFYCRAFKSNLSDNELIPIVLKTENAFVQLAKAQVAWKIKCQDKEKFNRKAGNLQGRPKTLTTIDKRKKRTVEFILKRLHTGQYDSLEGVPFSDLVTLASGWLKEHNRKKKNNKLKPFSETRLKPILLEFLDIEDEKKLPNPKKINVKQKYRTSKR